MFIVTLVSLCEVKGSTYLRCFETGVLSKHTCTHTCVYVCVCACTKIPKTMVSFVKVRRGNMQICCGVTITIP